MTVVAKAEFPRSYDIQALISLFNLLVGLFKIRIILCLKTFYIKKCIDYVILFDIFFMGVIKWTIVQR